MNNTTVKQMLIVGAICLSAPAVLASDWTGNVSGFAGTKMMDDQDWPNLDNPTELGVIFDIQQQDWPISLSLDAFAAADVYERGTLEDTLITTEIHVGVRKIFNQSGTVQPYVGGGLALVNAEWEQKSGTTTTTEDDNAVGPWVGAGMYVAVTDNINVGFDARYSEADVTVFGQERNAGGVHAGLTAGYRF